MSMFVVFSIFIWRGSSEWEQTDTTTDQIRGIWSLARKSR